MPSVTKPEMAVSNCYGQDSLSLFIYKTINYYYL
jgi:hypothetical protein